MSALGYALRRSGARASGAARQSGAVRRSATIALALFVLGAFLLVTSNVERALARLERAAELSVYLRGRRDVASTRGAIESSSSASGVVAGREYVSKDDALTRFRHDFAELADVDRRRVEATRSRRRSRCACSPRPARPRAAGRLRAVLPSGLASPTCATTASGWTRLRRSCTGDRVARVWCWRCSCARRGVDRGRGRPARASRAARRDRDHAAGRRAAQPTSAGRSSSKGLLQGGIGAARGPRWRCWRRCSRRGRALAGAADAGHPDRRQPRSSFRCGSCGMLLLGGMVVGRWPDSAPPRWRWIAGRRVRHSLTRRR